MSMMYCKKHDKHYDLDFVDQCPICENEELKGEDNGGVENE